MSFFQIIFSVLNKPIFKDLIYENLIFVMTNSGLSVIGGSFYSINANNDFSI